MRCLLALRTWAAQVVLLLVVLAASGIEARAGTITNVARADWRTGDSRVSALSNSVVLDVSRPASRLNVFIASNTSDRTLLVPADDCGSSSQVLSPIVRTAVPVLSVNQIRPGQDLILQVIEPSANRDPNLVDVLVLVTETPSFGRQVISISETGVNSGEFVARLRTSATDNVQNNCSVAVKEGETARLAAMLPDGQEPLSSADVAVLADPFGFVFDSSTGQPVSGVRVTMVEAGSGLPAQVFAEDRVTPWPSSVTTGEPVMDGAGNIYRLEAGQFWFPLAPVGTYRLVVEPPQPFGAPSQAPAARLAALIAPDGKPFAILPASFGAPFALADATPVQIDIPVDRAITAPRIARSVSRERVAAGDVVFHTVTLTNPDTAGATALLTLTENIASVMRLRRDTIRLNGQSAEAVLRVAGDGQTFTMALGSVLAGRSVRVTYAVEVRADAVPGRAVNRADVDDGQNAALSASAMVTVIRDTIAGRMTLIGRVSAGSCEMTKDRSGIGGVRILLEDGSFAVTDSEGRYHFDGVVPGTHVVQLVRATLPKGARPVDCTGSTRNAGSPGSRFIIGQGGSLAVADFSVAMPDDWKQKPVEAATPAHAVSDEQSAAGAIDWLALGDGPDGWLFPEVDHNPRSPSIRVAIRHRKGQSVRLMVDGKPVDPLSFDGVQVPKVGRYAVSLWRGIPLRSDKTSLTAEIINTLGGVSANLSREVHFSSRASRFELVRERSLLVADGGTSPVLAVRVLDPAGKPLRAGMTGGFTINPPHESASQIEREQLRQVSAIGQTGARWRVEADDGIAMIKLAPTMVSGGVRLSFDLSDAEISRRQELEAWLTPGDIEWTIVGLAEGSVGAKTVADNMQRGRFPTSDQGKNARVALYAKGRVLGKYLMTLAYDSAKQADDQPVLGTINPSAYYTVFADGSTRRFDAASREKLYVRIETATFQALYGDFQTNFDQTKLARYTRTATGISAQARVAGVQAEGFAAKIGSRFRRDEFQGAGITGPYPLRTRAIIANTERVAVETRDRFRSEIVLERRPMARFADYDVDLLAGAIRFRQPVASRDVNLNPQIIVVEYEVDSLGGGEINAGIRATVQNNDDTLRLGVTAVTDKGNAGRTHLGAMDIRARLAQNTEVRAELAFSQSAGKAAKGWSVEAQHRTGTTEIIAYAQALDADYGVGQQSGAELGRRKFGLDARTRLGDATTALISAWEDESLADASRRRAIQVQGTHRTGNSEYRLSLSNFDDLTIDGRSLASTMLEAGATQHFLDKRLEVSASASIALGRAGSIDLPARHQFGARYAVTPDVRLSALYEIANGSGFDTSAFRGGVEVTPWQGVRVNTELGQRKMGPVGASTFAALGLSQSVQITPSFLVDAKVESSRTIAGTPSAANVINPAQPPSSGGQLSVDGNIFEDFSAVSLGGTYRRDRWTGMVRAEWRDGDIADRRGLTFGAIRQMGEGAMVGSSLSWTKAMSAIGGESEIFDAALAFATRPAASAFAFLGKLEYRSDEVRGLATGFDLAFANSGAGRTALITGGDALSRRLLASFSGNWTPRGSRLGHGSAAAAEVGVFLAGRYSFDQFEGLGINSFALLGGLDGHVSLTPALEVGGSATVRSNLTSGATTFAYGPSIGVVPGNGVLFTLGFNVEGFRDIDYSHIRDTDQGPYASLRVKFDADSFSFLGLNGRGN